MKWLYIGEYFSFFNKSLTFFLLHTHTQIPQHAIMHKTTHLCTNLLPDNATFRVIQKDAERSTPDSSWYVFAIICYHHAPSFCWCECHSYPQPSSPHLTTNHLRSSYRHHNTACYLVSIKSMRILQFHLLYIETWAVLLPPNPLNTIIDELHFNFNTH